MLTYDEKTSGEIARGVTLLRTQLERLAAAPILLDGRDARAAVSAGGVCISVGLTEDCRSDGDWAAMSIDGYHVIGRGDSPEAAVLKMRATEARLHRVVEAITGSRCAEVRSPEDLLYERVMCGGVYVDAPYSPRHYAGWVEIDGYLRCTVSGPQREKIVAVLEAAGLPVAGSGETL